jgi:hypothetical protein
MSLRPVKDLQSAIFNSVLSRSVYNFYKLQSDDFSL